MEFPRKVRRCLGIHILHTGDHPDPWISLDFFDLKRKHAVSRIQNSTGNQERTALAQALSKDSREGGTYGLTGHLHEILDAEFSAGNVMVGNAPVSHGRQK